MTENLRLLNDWVVDINIGVTEVKSKEEM